MHYEARSGTLEDSGPLIVPVLDHSEVHAPRTFLVNFVSLASPGLTNRQEVTILAQASDLPQP